MKLLIDQTKTTPLIDFNATENTFLIQGKSLSANAQSFYEPVFNWIDSNVENKINLDFKLEYFNTSSHKQLLIFFKKLNALNSENTICWYSESEDEEMLEVGQDMEKLSGVKFEFKTL